MKSLSTKVILGASCFALGIGAALAAQKYLHHSPRSAANPARVAKTDDPSDPNLFPTLQSMRAQMHQMDSLLDQFYKDDFFGGETGATAGLANPFEQMRNLRGQMMKDLDSPSEGAGIFDTWYRQRFGGGDVAEVKRREDGKYVYYDIAVKGLRNEKLNVKVADGQINISGQLEQKANSKNGVRLYSSFERSFPTPPNVDADKVQMLRTPDELTLKFPKLEAS